MTKEQWQKLSFFEQMANAGSEAERAINWRAKKDEKYAEMAFDRFLELIDFTIQDRKNLKHLPELTRVRETLIDYFSFKNQYGASDKLWRNYFYSFGYAAQIAKGL